MPLQFDLSYDELLTYGGTNPRPDDFDEFWDKALAELAAIDPRVEITPAEFQAPYARCEHLYFTGTGGTRVHAKLVRPLETAAPGPAVLMFHGYGGGTPAWVDLLPYAARGYTVAQLDVRGQVGLADSVQPAGGFGPRHFLVDGLDDGPERFFYRHVFLDARRLADVVLGLPEVDPDRVATTGHSQGGALSLVAAALEPRITLVATVFPFLTDYQRAYELSLGEEPYDEINQWFRKRDPRHLREAEVFERLGYIDIQHLAPRIRATVDFTSAFEDVVCPPSTQFATYNKLAGPKSLRIYPDHGHDELPGLPDILFEVLGTL
jgi:cephalosporin-C deacetylase